MQEGKRGFLKYLQYLCIIDGTGNLCAAQVKTRKTTTTERATNCIYCVMRLAYLFNLASDIFKKPN